VLNKVMKKIKVGKVIISPLLGFIPLATTIPLILTAHTPVLASCAATVSDGGFEQQQVTSVQRPWVREGRAGMDIGNRLSLSGRNNAWIRHNQGWNGIRQAVNLRAGSTYTLTAMVRTSGNLTDGYFGFRDAQQRPVSEIKFGAMTNYRELKVVFRPHQTGTYHVFTGLWALNQDTWAQIDEVQVTGGGCADVE
jgi:hypothetical protein